MNALTILEWNLHKMTHATPVKPFVCRRISEQNPDLICLVEYRDDAGIRNTLGEHYWIAESDRASGNQVLLAVRKTLAPDGIRVLRTKEEPGCFNFLHVSFSLPHTGPFALLGIRMLSPTDASQQTPPLRRYLARLDTPFVCAGDFNILGRRMPVWFPGFPLETQLGTGPLAHTSYLYTDRWGTVTGTGDLDHMLSSPGLNIQSEYLWDFVEEDGVYPPLDSLKSGTYWDIPPACPDHAVMLAQLFPEPVPSTLPPCIIGKNAL